VSVGQAFYHLGLSRIRVNSSTDGGKAEAAGDGQREFVDHLPGMAGDDGGAKDLVRPFAQVDAGKTFLLAIEDSAINIG